MRKSILNASSAQSDHSKRGDWIDLSQATVQISSEDPAYPIEHALVEGETGGWRAASAGKQTIRLIFEQPRRLGRIHIAFRETVLERSQEFAIAWSPESEGALREVVRQQWNFSQDGSTEETEDYAVALDNVVVLQLEIDPDRGQNSARASLERLRLA